MKLLIPAIAATLLSCVSCIKTDYRVGGRLIPVDQTYNIFSEETAIPEVRMMMADSLSGFSNSRITIGAVRDGRYGLSTRSSALTLIPMFSEADFGENPQVMNFHFAAAMDTVSVSDPAQWNVLQNVNVYELSRPIDASKDFDCNASVPHGSARITRGRPVVNGKDSLSFDFSREYAERYLSIKDSDLKDMDTYLAKFPGIYIDTDKPLGKGGRFNMFKLQLGFDKSNYYISGNCAALTIRTKYPEWDRRKDTTFFFFYGATDMFDIDSLLTNGTAGSLPEYSLNMSTHETREMEGEATDRVFIEGGGGLKPVITARTLKDAADAIIASKGASPENVVINKATIVLPFEFPDDYREMERFPEMLSPTCKIKVNGVTSFMGLTDASSSDENQGDIDRSNLNFAPDITYHMQELMKMDDKKIESGQYDIWFLIMANETVTTTNSSSNDMSEYYQLLAYQNYYNSMYGGYGYGGYGGYGGGYGNYYQNYYSYMMMAAYANSNQSSTSISQQLDKDRFYLGQVNGPAAERHPVLELTFSVPKSEN